MIEMFNSWCRNAGLASHPALPSTVASFIGDVAYLGVNKVLDIVGAISAAHINVADPTLGPQVAKAINRIQPIDAPRSWPKEHKVTFKLLPYALQRYLRERTEQVDKEVRRAQNEAATARQKLTQSTAI